MEMCGIIGVTSRDLEAGAMKKTVYLIGGTMGVGKTTCCNFLKLKSENAVFLDGDWCWDASPFQVTEETKTMVLDNICYLLNNFIHCSAYENIIFCWVMHEQSIIDTILSRLDLQCCNVKVISLICSEAALMNRLQHDIDRGIRHPDIIARSLSRISMYNKLNTIQIDISDLTPEEVAEELSIL
jgi:hypothetical protein